MNDVRLLIDHGKGQRKALRLSSFCTEVCQKVGGLGDESPLSVFQFIPAKHLRDPSLFSLIICHLDNLLSTFILPVQEEDLSDLPLQPFSDH